MGAETINILGSKSDWDTAVNGNKDTLLIVDAFAEWCGPCKMIAPKVADFSREYSDVKFYKVDVDEVPDVAHELGIRAMPTFKFFKNGEEVAEVVGANARALEAAIKKHK